MSERVVNFSDLTGQMIEGPDQRVELVVTDHPDLDQPVRLEAMPSEVELLGKLALKDPVVLDVTHPDEEESKRYVLTVPNFNKLATDKERPMDQILADATPLALPRPSQRRSHNKTTNGEPLRTFNSLESAGLGHATDPRRHQPALRLPVHSHVRVAPSWPGGPVPCWGVALCHRLHAHVTSPSDCSRRDANRCVVTG
ncbi:MAG TPA: hypothetical protein VGS08_06295 [Candidatus Saccharimonadales bacterium]|nr:hypothetical protein [Candidatus Saccharimonadales bacterium]